MANSEAWQEGWNIGKERMDQRRAHKQALSDEELQGKISELVENRKAIQRKLPTLLDEKGNPTPQYNDAIQSLTQNAQALREIYHPNVNPSAVTKFGHLLTDALHITRPEDRIKKEGAKRAANVAGDEREALGVAAAAPVSPVQTAQQQTQIDIARQNAQNDATIAWLKKNNAPQEIIDQAVQSIAKVHQSKAKALTGSKPYKGADGKYYQAVQNSDGTISAEEMPPDYVPSAPSGGPVRAWQKDSKGRIFSVLVDRQSNKPVPGSENYDLLPPPYLTPSVTSGVYHWVDENNQIHETPESHERRPVLPGGSAPMPSGNATPKKAPTGSGQGSTPTAGTGKSGDRILGSKGSAPLNKANSAYADAVKIANLADDAVNNPSAEKDALFVLGLIRSEAGRVNQQEIQQLFNTGGLAEAPERWAAKAGHGQLSPDLRKQLQDFTHSNLTASKAAVDSLKSTANANTTSGGKFTAFVDGDTIYDIPADKVAAFKKKHPNAKEQ